MQVFVMLSNAVLLLFVNSVNRMDTSLETLHYHLDNRTIWNAGEGGACLKFLMLRSF